MHQLIGNPTEETLRMIATDAPEQMKSRRYRRVTATWNG